MGPPAAQILARLERDGIAEATRPGRRSAVRFTSSQQAGMRVLSVRWLEAE